MLQRRKNGKVAVVHIIHIHIVVIHVDKLKLHVVLHGGSCSKSKDVYGYKCGTCGTTYNSSGTCSKVTGSYTYYSLGCGYN